jgi:hypothetical protein
MYRYFKRFTDGKYEVVFDNKLIGVVVDNIYDNEQDAINRVNHMNKIN